MTIAAVMLLAGCQIETSGSIRSGTIKDANVEEPLTEGAKKYERALIVSNQVLDRVAARDYQRIYQENLDSSLKLQITEATFVSMLQQLEKNAGPLAKYKRMQWAFDRSNDKGYDVVTSTKIVQHQNRLLSYRFVFRDDGRYTRLVGFHYSWRKN